MTTHASGTAVTDPDALDDDSEPALPPDEPSVPLGRWIRENLFSNVFNGVLTIVFGLLALVSLRGLLNFVFSEERRWDAVRVNLRLLFTSTYPESQFARIWVTVGVIVVLTGISLGLAKQSGGVSFKKISMWFMTAGGFIALAVVLREPSVLKTPDGTPVLDADNQVVRESFADAMSDRGVWWLTAVVLLGIGAAIWFRLGDYRRRTTFVPTMTLVFIGLGALVASAWVVHWGHYAFADGEFVFEPGRTVAFSTKLPWTVMYGLMLGSFLLARRIGPRYVSRVRVALAFAWLLSPFLLFWVILRDPDIDYSHVWSTDLPMALAFMVIGGLVLWALSSPTIGELGRIAAVALMGVAAFNWLAAFAGWYPMLQKARISFLLLALVAMIAPNFAADRGQRLRLVLTWGATMAILHYLVTLINSPSTVVSQTPLFFGGFSITIFVAVLTLIFSFPLGVMLALARTSKMPIFRVLATAYIEFVRGIPLITVLIFFSIMVNLFLPEGMELSDLAAVSLGFSLFSAAYLAENVRGGLQAVRQGQYEASDALGLTTFQRTLFIVLPQGLRVSIPPLVGQVIATFKETSLLSIIGIFDFLRVANSIVPSQTEFLGVKREGLLFVSFMYWIFAFSMSKYSQRLERRLGVGER